MSQAQIRVRLFDGARLPLDPTAQVLLTLRPQFSSRHLFSGFRRGNDFTFNVETPEDGSGFAVLASAKDFEDAGISPVKVGDSAGEEVHLMLLRRSSSFQFARARWDRLDTRPSLLRFLMGFDTDAAKVGARYTELLEFQPDSLACLLNITAALELLPIQNPSLGFQNGLDYLKAVEWGQGIRKDRR